jgi:regulator of nonsense transcripts 2
MDATSAQPPSTNTDSLPATASSPEERTEEQQIQQYIKDREERLKIKLDYRAKNKPGKVESLRLDDSVLKKLDSSIKKVTSFIKRLKTMTESQKDTLRKDMLQLNLTKYLSEVAVAFTEVKLKMNDIACAVHLCSLMHQSYAEFAAALFEQWQKILNLKKEDRVPANPSKMRVDLRFFAELVTVNVLPEKESLSLLGNQLTILTVYDKEFANISIITSFLKTQGEDFVDLVPARYQELATKYNLVIPSNNLYGPEKQKAVKGLFKEYFKSLTQHLVHEHEEIQKMERQNKKTYQVAFFFCINYD